MFHDEIALCGINSDQLSITRNNMADGKEYLKRRDNQSHPDMKVHTLIDTNYKESDLAFTAAVRRYNSLI